MGFAAWTERPVKSGAVRLIEVSAGRATRLLHVPKVRISTRQAERRSVELPGRSCKWGRPGTLCKRAGAVAADGDEATVMQQTIEHADRHAGAHRAAEPARRRLTALAPSRESCLVPSLAELVLTVMLFVVLWVPDAGEPPSFLFRGVS